MRSYGNAFWHHPIRGAGDEVTGYVRLSLRDIRELWLLPPMPPVGPRLRARYSFSHPPCLISALQSLKSARNRIRFLVSMLLGRQATLERKTRIFTDRLRSLRCGW